MRFASVKILIDYWIDAEPEFAAEVQATMADTKVPRRQCGPIRCV